MVAELIRWIPILTPSELRRELGPVLERAVPLFGKTAVEELWGAWPHDSLDLLWATDAGPFPASFADRAAALLGERADVLVVARTAAAEAAALAGVGRFPLEQLARGEGLAADDAFLLPFDDRRLPSTGWIGDGGTVEALSARIRGLAGASVPVLVHGESGTGKELVARALHRLGDRAGKPWLALNCAELAEGMIESELFGHRRGAFTGALRDRDGLLAAAGGGTVFLDEIAELSRAAQAKLLRAVEEHHVRPIGSERSRPIDCRIVAATNRDLAAAAAAGEFRADLLYRLRGAEITLPPLRTRGHEVLHLAETFAARAALRFRRPVLGLAADALLTIRAHDWPGNVRELRQVIDAAVLAARDDSVRATDLAIAGAAATGATPPEPIVTARALERAHLLRALEATAGKRTAAARLLGLSRQSLARRLRRHGLEAAAGPRFAQLERRSP